MIILTILSIFLFLNISNTERVVNWNTEEIEKTVRPFLRKFDDSWEVHTSNIKFYHYKNHFGIIIKKGTTLSVTTEALKKHTNFRFYCIVDNFKDLQTIYFYMDGNITKTLTTKNDCVPMTSVSYNVDVEVKLKTKNWIDLPVFDLRNLTYLMAEDAEREFYKKVEIYGFAENYYVQMLLTAKDIRELQSKKHSLFVGLQNQVDVIKHYNYLTSASRYINKNDSYAYALVEKYRIFSFSVKDSTGSGFRTYGILSISPADEFLNPTRALKWGLLHAIGCYYIFQKRINGIGEVENTWSNIYSAFYQHKFSNANHWIKYQNLDNNRVLTNYRNGITIDNKKWDFKGQLHIFLTLFGYDGTDKSFREFNIRYFSKKNTDRSNILPIVLEVFLDLYNINMLPFLKRVIDFNTIYDFPFALELQLLTGRAVMPAVDFGLKPTDMKLRSRERDWRPYLPLMLMTKMIKNYVQVTFAIDSPTDPTGACLYLNNVCHIISEKQMMVKVLTDVYSVYVLCEKDHELYASDIEYHTISKDTEIFVKVKDLRETEKSLSLIKNAFIIEGYDSIAFMKIFINYRTMNILIRQIKTDIHISFKNKLYFSISLERNKSTVFEYNFLGYPERKETLEREHNFQINDKIHVYHAEPNRLKFDLKNYRVFNKNNTFLLTRAGLHNIADEEQKLIPLQIKNIYDSYLNCDGNLPQNAYFQAVFTNYMNVLRSTGFEEMIPQKCMNHS